MANRANALHDEAAAGQESVYVYMYMNFQDRGSKLAKNLPLSSTLEGQLRGW